MSLFATKPLSRIMAESEGEHSLKRTLGPMQLVALGIGAIIGAGLFSLTGIAAAHHAGPAVTISFVIAAIGCAFAGLCYSEFATMIPIAGSAYTYSYATMGELLAWIIGWDLVLEYAVGAATVAVSWSGYVNSLLLDFGLHLPVQWINSPFSKVTLENGEVVHGIMNVPAILVVGAITAILIIGIQESARVNAVVVVLKVMVVVLFIVVGWAYINPANYTPYIPENTGLFGHFGWSGVLRGAGVVFFAFIGFDAVSTAAQEAKRPQRDMPIGIIGSLIVCTILYVLFAHVMTGIAPFMELDSAAPVAVAVDKTPYAWLKTAVKLAIIAGYTSVILVMLLGQSRVFYSMSRDGLLPKLFSDVHPKLRTPWRSNILLFVLVGAFAAFAPIQVVGEMTSIGTLFAFVLVSIGILVMRKTNPDHPRPFKTPWVPLVPILGILFNVALMFGLGKDNWMRLGVWMALGLLIYFMYSRHHSKLRIDTAAANK
ncbi:MAG: amino acid permease [Bryobacteraceae bacterium]|nr:amino acid permease [Solibacteraceae bacterium]MCL4844583.1 amino acid permease [Bryobacteraceae bacterium]MCO5353862.1 amino acid permease [Bryobacteraceae bacterium]